MHAPNAFANPCCRQEDNPNTTADEWLDLLLLATPVLAGAAYLAAATWTHTKARAGERAPACLFWFTACLSA